MNDEESARQAGKEAGRAFREAIEEEIQRAREIIEREVALMKAALSFEEPTRNGDDE